MGAASSNEYFPAPLEGNAPDALPRVKRIGPEEEGGGRRRVTSQRPGAPANALGLSAQELADVRRLHCLLARDASKHCVNMHIK